jgi:hypothetical protein
MRRLTTEDDLREAAQATVTEGDRLSMRSIGWLLRNGYRYSCRYCCKPHRNLRTERCCGEMKLDRI